MVESANLWKGNNLACFGALDRPVDRAVLDHPGLGGPDAIRHTIVMWSHIVGQFGSAVKVYSDA